MGEAFTVLRFVENQILGMNWLNNLLSSLLTFLGVDLTNQWGKSLQFFIYDIIKIICFCAF